MSTLTFSPLFASALQFAFDKATIEGKLTIGFLVILSLFSWTVIITKARQLYQARKMSKKFYSAYRATRDPLEIFKREEEFPGAPAFEVYFTGAEELVYHLKNNPVEVAKRLKVTNPPMESIKGAHTDFLARSIVTKISNASFDSVKVALERSVSAQALSLEKGMIVLSTAVAGGPFIGLLGTVWGVMETFSGIARVQAASLTAMAPALRAHSSPRLSACSWPSRQCSPTTSWSLWCALSRRKWTTSRPNTRPPSHMPTWTIAR